MDEDNYRQIYQQVNTAPCVFEKAILSLRCRCACQQLFRLADRQGVSCVDPVKQQHCKLFLNHLRQQTHFVFKINIEGPLPHNKEIKVQNGGMLGMQKLLLTEQKGEIVEDISALIEKSTECYGAIVNIPYNLLMPSVTSFKTRPKRQRRK